MTGICMWCKDGCKPIRITVDHYEFCSVTCLIQWNDHAPQVVYERAIAWVEKKRTIWN
jgi:hypothetical protein